jgi:phosphatidylglycerol---prolipoprotein diacylglyceryl transferase
VLGQRLRTVHWNPDPVLFIIGPLVVHWYGFLFTLGLLATFWVGHERFKQRGLEEKDASNLSFILMIALFVGAHVGYFVFYRPGELLRNPAVLFDFRQGLASHGGGIGVVVAVWAYARWRKVDFRDYADAVMLSAVWLFPFIRVGNFFNSEIVGRPTDLPWGVVFEAAGFTQPRHPVQLYEAAMNVALIGMSIWLHRNRATLTKGATCLILMALYFTGRFSLEFVKEFQDMEDGQWWTRGAQLSLPPAVICWALLWWIRPVFVPARPSDPIAEPPTPDP